MKPTSPTIYSVYTYIYIYTYILFVANMLINRTVFSRKVDIGNTRL